MEKNQKQLEKKPVTERIKNMNDVLEELGPNHPLVAQYRHYLDTTDPEQHDEYLATFMQLRMVCAAINEGWLPTFEPGEHRYWPWFWLYKDRKTAERYKVSGEEIIEISAAVRACLLGGGASNGALAGLVYSYSDDAPGSADAYVGSRLCFKSRELAIYAAKTFFELWIKFYCM
ncbi:MAG: hypothetical protein IKQ52_09750 [Bacteroidales bacterium]|nr:hypothetical protein [Bacteroidales bacterium]MBR6905021.1 hypothetical protein [Bacteroidales bacterium]